MMRSISCPQLALNRICPCGDFGADQHYLPEVGSTNALLRQLSNNNWVHGRAVFTDFQSRGRGRQGRAWLAPRNSSVLMSLALTWPGNVPMAQSTMLAALAVADAIQDSVGLSPTLKWPNDLLIESRKVCGILAETVGPLRLIVGIGLNVNFDASREPEIGSQATSLSAESGRTVDREKLAGALLRSLGLWYGVLTGYPDALFHGWKSRLQTLGRPVSVEDVNGRWHGVASDVRADGGLIVRSPDGTERAVFAAQVSIRAQGDSLQTASAKLQ